MFVDIFQNKDPFSHTSIGKDVPIVTGGEKIGIVAKSSALDVEPNI